MRILFASSEGAPYIKTGGLGDVTYALPHEIATNQEMDVAIVLPYYQKIKQDQTIAVEFVNKFEVSLAWRKCYCGIFRARTKKANLSYYFIDNDYYFGSRAGVYGEFDDVERFSFFSKAIVEMVLGFAQIPDVIHCNDWQTALVPLLLSAKSDELSRIKTVFTIHNIEYQGKVGIDFFDGVLGLDSRWLSVLEYDGCLNLIKSAIVMANKITTVSKTYACEIRHAYFAHGLEGVLREFSYKLTGIVNGIDQSLYDPKTSRPPIEPFSADELAGKAKNKRVLQKTLGLEVDESVPMVAMITRFVSHKGLDLVEFVADALMQMPIQFVVVGTGEERYQDLFCHLAQEHPQKMSANILFDHSLAMQVYASSDLFLMPSKSEPCGLAQLIAMRYGTIPIVRETGGLVDTVFPLNAHTLEGCGFTFKTYNAHDMLGAVERAVAFWQDAKKRFELQKKIMQLDHSWKQPVEEYLRIYRD